MRRSRTKILDQVSVAQEVAVSMPAQVALDAWWEYVPVRRVEQMGTISAYITFGTTRFVQLAMHDTIAMNVPQRSNRLAEKSFQNSHGLR